VSLRSLLGLSRLITDRAEAVRFFERKKVACPYKYEEELVRLRRGEAFRLEVWSGGYNIELWDLEVT